VPKVKNIVRQLIVIAVVVAVTVYFVWAFSARKMADLAPEHRIEFAFEFDAAQEATADWPAYLAIEDSLASELASAVDSHPRPGSMVDRHDAASLTYPDNLAVNWNRSYEMMASSPRGVAVLLHGLSDSPYSMLTTARTLVEAGFSVVVPRLPGHGFAVGGLRQARWEDWTATVRIAVRHAMRLAGEESSLVLAGYSNGGLLAIDYALRCEEYADLTCPDRLVLMSPAIAVWIPYFEKFQWLSIMPEVDPFKFTSFPKRAAWETYQVSTRMHKELARPAEAAKLPPILTFQSVVDNTINAPAIIRNLYSHLPANGSKIVVYDVNRHSTFLSLMKNLPRDPTTGFTAAAPLQYDVTILRNRDADTDTIDVVELPSGSNEQTVTHTNLRWPRGIYSLSHIAVPFQQDDKVYGDGTGPSQLPVTLGAMAPRGEAGVLLLGSDYFLRTRYNPFYSVQAEILTAWLSEL
jgi:alpha-beta hydrolase superfamily lysophospholipase